MNARPLWIRGAPDAVREFVCESDLEKWARDPSGYGQISMDAPVWIPSGSCFRFEGRDVSFGMQTEAVRGVE